MAGEGYRAPLLLPLPLLVPKERCHPPPRRHLGGGHMAQEQFGHSRPTRRNVLLGQRVSVASSRMLEEWSPQRAVSPGPRTDVEETWNAPKRISRSSQGRRGLRSPSPPRVG